MTYRCLGHLAQVSCAHFLTGLDKTNIPRIPALSGGNNINNSHLVQYLKTNLGEGCLGSQLRLSIWRSPLSCKPGPSIKRIFPNTDPAGLVSTGTFYNPYTVLYFKFTWLSPDIPLLGSPEPIFSLGLDKTNLSLVPAPSRTKGATILITRIVSCT